MSTSYRRPFGQGSQQPGESDVHDVPIRFDAPFLLSDATYQKPSWEADAQIAARRAMAQRNSRSYSKRASRSMSRKKTKVGRPAKPTLDTSFTRHKGSLPRQVYPKDSDLKTGGSVKKGWFGMSRSGTRGRGLGIMKGTPQPERGPVDLVTSMQHEPTQADDLLTPATRAWMETVSPSERAIPIGISLPTDSLPDLSPYQTTRDRSESGALAAPSIIITPAVAMQSVWSPDTATESEYTPSIYSRVASHQYFTARSDAPPVPALPQGLRPTQNATISSDSQNTNTGAVNRARNDTLDSAGTDFDDLDFDNNRKPRIMSSATVFEEDESPLTARNEHTSVLTVDTSVMPTPLRSHGWWDHITTPFEFSKTNSVWTQGGKNTGQAPDIPMIPQQFGALFQSPSPITETWSATEKSPSENGNTPMIPMSVSAAFKVSASNSDRNTEDHAEQARLARIVSDHMKTVRGTASVAQSTKHSSFDRLSRIGEPDVASPVTARSPSPVVGTAAIGTVMTARHTTEQSSVSSTTHYQAPAQQQQPHQPINVNIVFNDRRPEVFYQTANGSSSTIHKPVGLPSAPNVFVKAAESGRGDDSRSFEASPRKASVAGSQAVDSARPSIEATKHTPPAPTRSGRGTPVSTAAQPNPPAFPSSQAPVHFPPPPRQATFGSFSTVTANSHTDSAVDAKKAPFQFPPPPQFGQDRKQTIHEEMSRASSPVSTTELKGEKRHRKVFNLADWLPASWRRRGNGKSGKAMSRRKKWCWGCCCCLLILVLIAILVPVIVVVSRKKEDVPNGTQSPLQGPDSPLKWMNLTGYPPMPVGVATIAQPEAVEKESGCVAPATAWSCALPKEEHESIKPNKPDQPNLRFEILFENGTVADASKTQPVKRASNAVSVGAFMRSLLHSRAGPSPVPAPAAPEDYTFLSETADGNQAPFEGESTPFFLSLLDAKTLSSRLLKRQTNNGNVTSNLPPPQLNPDGTAAHANLLPTVSNQPLRLFNRGTENEHYGFFVYYDRSIFLKERQRNFTRGGNPADQDGGSPFEAATMRCTWAQTRFLVQIWTRSEAQKPLLGASAGSDGEAFKRPGTFPYPVTVTVDRRGGRQTEKTAYCYDMQTDGTIVNDGDDSIFLREDRGFGGNNVRPGGGPGRLVQGPIDGGSGGCKCQWQNWLSA
ncbi:hypothetical protein M011DRAFT_464410 [Sporormia fimetaria CBS 119925]|uniref:Glycoprotease family protein n=1 Tax=Sporormia fimetaria CBS 119925 TaxID=1340428 RepID=A0A6A6VJ10_9PLEO|nr:hypothetical protein M011DRAFT_464410 [Sporormia fimetaria CBS 119925]